MMNCSEFDQLLHDLDRPGTASRERELALTHAETCSRCARLLTETEALNYALGQIASRDRQAEAPARVESVLLREFQIHAGRLNGRMAGKRQLAQWYRAVGAVAAVALLALGLMRLRIRAFDSSPIALRPAVVSSTKNVPAPEMDVDPSDAQNAGYASAEEAGAFVALPDADDSASLEGGAVVRVAIPRAALASWGLPVPGVAGGDTIPAELLVGADGTPQGIRLVSESSND
jgi:hypothetical protein